MGCGYDDRGGRPVSEREASEGAADLLALLIDARDCLEDLIFKPPERSKDVGDLAGRCRLVLDEIAKVARGVAQPRARPGVEKIDREQL
jgi:hypothetical protein